MKQEKYEYGCVMLNFHIPEIKKIHNKIDREDLHENGIEKETHVTLLYGLHTEVSEKEVEHVLKFIPLFRDGYYAVNPSLFKLPEYDVLKFDVHGSNLDLINKALRLLPYTNRFEEYKPHLTIAYLKPGRGEKYLKLFEGSCFPNLAPHSVVYKKPEGGGILIPISIL